MGTHLIGPCGVSHIAVVTTDLDRFRAFYEDVIGLRTTVVFGAGPGHAREAVLVVGSGAAMLQVFEIAGYDPAANGLSSAMFERGRLDHIGFTVPDVASLTASATGCSPSARPVATSGPSGRCCLCASPIPTGCRAKFAARFADQTRAESDIPGARTRL